MSALRGMVSFFTMIRLDITQQDMDDMDGNFRIVPVIGILYGLMASSLMLLSSKVLPMGAAAVLTLFAVHGMNRFLHLDGTMDLGDGLAVAGTREDHVRALKDTRVGAGGTAFAMFVVLLTAAALSGTAMEYIVLAPFAAEVLAKNSMVSAAAFGRPGEGMAGNSVRRTSPKDVLVSTAISVLALAGLSAASVLLGHPLPEGAHIVLASAAAVSVVTGAVLSAVAGRNFGMVNGDVLGAANEISRMITLILMLALASVI